LKLMKLSLEVNVLESVGVVQKEKQLS